MYKMRTREEKNIVRQNKSQLFFITYVYTHHKTKQKRRWTKFPGRHHHQDTGPQSSIKWDNSPTHHSSTETSGDTDAWQQP